MATPWPGRLRIDWTGLPPRTRSLLVNAGFATIGEVAAKTDAELLALPGFGQGMLRLVRAEIKRLGVGGVQGEDAPPTKAQHSAPDWPLVRRGTAMARPR